jgi:hypothetical protein
MSGMDMGPGSDLGSRFGQSLVMPVEAFVAFLVAEFRQR